MKMHFYGGCAPGGSKVCVFMVDALPEVQKYGLLRWVRWVRWVRFRGAESMHFYGCFLLQRALPIRVFYVAFVQGALPVRVFCVAFVQGAPPVRVFYVAFVQGALHFRVFYVLFVQGALPVRVFYVTGPDDTV